MQDSGPSRLQKFSQYASYKVILGVFWCIFNCKLSYSEDLIQFDVHLMNTLGIQMHHWGTVMCVFTVCMFLNVLITVKALGLIYSGLIWGQVVFVYLLNYFFIWHAQTELGTTY